MGFLSELFGTIYETWFGIYNQDFESIFKFLYENDKYSILGSSLLIIPLIMFILFYFLWKNPYGKLIHWVFWLILTTILVFLTSFGIAYSVIVGTQDLILVDLYNNPLTNYLDYAESLPLKYATINALLSLALSFLWSLFFKQMSKLHLHLPF